MPLRVMAIWHLTKNSLNIMETYSNPVNINVLVSYKNLKKYLCCRVCFKLTGVSQNLRKGPVAIN